MIWRLSLSLLLMIMNPVYAETNLDAAWNSCVNAAYSVVGYVDFEQVDWTLDYTWSDDISVQCHQIQDMKISAERVAQKAKLKLLQDEWLADKTRKSQEAIPLIQRALTDPLGNVK